MKESFFSGSKSLLLLLMLFSSSLHIVVTSYFRSHCMYTVFGGGKTVMVRYCVCGSIIMLSLS